MTDVAIAAAIGEVNPRTTGLPPVATERDSVYPWPSPRSSLVRSRYEPSDARELSWNARLLTEAVRLGTPTKLPLMEPLAAVHE